MAFDWPGNGIARFRPSSRERDPGDEGPLHMASTLFEEHRAVAVTAADSEWDNTLIRHERRLIEDTLQQTRGRVSGRFGAAERLGIPASTLESKIRRLHISKIKYRF